jgi:hypothetical protein
VLALNEHGVILHLDSVSFHGLNAGWGSDLTGSNVEGSAMEIAFNFVAIEKSFGERARAMRAQVIHNKKSAVNIEYCEFFAFDIKPLGFTAGYGIGGTNFNERFWC